ncbi:hypothetical protein [Emticicia aquatica]|jgi:hypothetical protein|nr:hypothetical protein [Emticicia aquatica]
MGKILLISLLLIGCAQSDNQNSTKIYFDLAGLVSQQITELNKNQPLTHKNLLIEDNEEAINTTKINWQKELDLFLQADLNKQSYQLSYNKQETPLMAIYTLKEHESLPVRTLKIIFDKDNTPKHIEAFMQVKNYLYESEKNLSMDFDKKQLKSYQIEGWQELFVGKKKRFKINGLLVHKK